MKLYYDMLIPYMPNSIINENGEAEYSAIHDAGRNAMKNLSIFQKDPSNIVPLYQAVINACAYAERDLVDVILGAIPHVDVSPDADVTTLLDESARLLFMSISKKYQTETEKFDVERFTAYILTATHILLCAATEMSTDVDSPEVE